MELGTRIEKSGWRQGAFLPPSLISQALGPSGHSATPGDLYVVITQSCDLVHRKVEGEPWCEVLRLRRIPRSDATFEHGRNARKIHVVVHEDGSPVPCEALAYDRFFLPREKLVDAPPLAATALSADTEKNAAQWIARRYSRPAFPDSFNARVASQRSSLKALINADHALLRHLYLRLSSFDELPDQQPYRMKLLLVAPSALWATRQKDIRALGANLIKILHSCTPRLDIVELLPLSDQQTSLALLDDYVPWQIFDYLTTRDEAIA